MPRRDGTGPMGAGAMSGRGLGFCAGADYSVNAGGGRGFGRSCRRGFFGRGRNFPRFFAGADAEMTPENRKEMLESQKSTLQSRLEEIDRQIESL